MDVAVCLTGLAVRVEKIESIYKIINFNGLHSLARQVGKLFAFLHEKRE